MRFGRHTVSASFSPSSCRERRNLITRNSAESCIRFHRALGFSVYSNRELMFEPRQTNFGQLAASGQRNWARGSIEPPEQNNCPPRLVEPLRLEYRMSIVSPLPLQLPPTSFWPMTRLEAVGSDPVVDGKDGHCEPSAFLSLVNLSNVRQTL